MYTQEQLDNAVTQEKERCIAMCKLVMVKHENRKDEDDPEVTSNFISGLACGAEDCIEAIEGHWT